MYCAFISAWVDESLNPQFAGWVKNQWEMTQVKCYAPFLKKNISLSNMGKQALTSHLDSVKHKKIQHCYWYSTY